MAYNNNYKWRNIQLDKQSKKETDDEEVNKRKEKREEERIRKNFHLEVPKYLTMWWKALNTFQKEEITEDFIFYRKYKWVKNFVPHYKRMFWKDMYLYHDADISEMRKLKIANIISDLEKEEAKKIEEGL